MNRLFGKKVLLVLFVLMIAVSMVFTGCDKDKGKDKTEDDGKLKGTLNITGSTSVQKAGEAIADAFMELHDEVTVNYQGVGSSNGVKAANDGSADIGTASRNQKEKEKEWKLNEYVIAKDGIAVAVHPSNPVSELTTEQIQKIFKGEITNWKDVGGDDKGIVVLNREAGSGTRGAFEEMLDVEDKITNKALEFNGNGPMQAAIASKEDAIGYVSFSYVDETIQPVKVDGVEATVANVLGGDYPISRPFLMLTKGEESKLTKAFLDFVMSYDGQRLVQKVGAIPVIQLEGTLNLTGSTSVQKLGEVLADELMKLHPNMTINYQGVGSSNGVKAANDGTADIGTASRNLKEKEKEWKLNEYVLCYDGIAIVVHPGNSVGELTKEQAMKIFKGEITNWKDVGGEDKDIIVCNREAGSGTRGAFEELMELEDQVTTEALEFNGNGPMQAAIASKPDGIGFVSFGYIDETVKPVKLDGVDATVENVLAGTYPLSRPFLMLTKGEENDLTRAFIDFALGKQGQNMAVKKGYIPVAE